MTWLSLTDALSPHPDRSAKTQAALRARSSPYREVSPLTAAEAALRKELLIGHIDGEDWQRKSACGGATRDLFYPVTPDPDDERIQPDKRFSRVEFERDVRLKALKELCASCPVQGQCLALYMRIGGRDKYACAAGTAWNERKQLATWIRIEMAGGCWLIDKVGWKARRLLFRAFRAEVLGKAPPKIVRPEPQQCEGHGDADRMFDSQTQCIVVTDTPWGEPVAVPYKEPWDSIPALGRAVRAEAELRNVELSSRSIETMLATLQVVDDLAEVRA